MDQLDIFRLLLIILLLTNNSEDDCDNSCSCSGRGLFGINQIMIILLLLNPPGSPTPTPETTF